MNTIYELTSVDSVTAGDLIPIFQLKNSDSRRVTVAVLVDYIATQGFGDTFYTKAEVDALLANISPASAVESNANITGLVGGTASDLDAVPTVSLTVGKTFILPSLSIGANVRSKTWTLVAGTEATDLSRGRVRPIDYAATTNEKYFQSL